MNAAAAIIAALLLGLHPAPPAQAPAKGQCEWMILTIPARGAMPRQLVGGLNYGQAIGELRLFHDDGIPARLGSACRP